MIEVTTEFNNLANGGFRPLEWGAGVSWDKSLAPGGWFTLDQSVLDGTDLLAPDDYSPVMPWNQYDYRDESDRLIDMTVERSVQFPYNVQSAMLDITLNNYDGRYSFDGGSEIQDYILPNRPIKTSLGFTTAGTVPVFIGVTEEMPEYSGVHNAQAQMSAIDYLSMIAQTSLKDMLMMRNVRTDEVIAEILNRYGLVPSQYTLEEGVNTIPFVYFSAGKNAGNALKELVQAENGALWMDEIGQIRFSARNAEIGSSVATFTPENIVEITPSRTSGIINRVKISADVREVKANQQIFSNDNSSGYQSAASSDNYRIAARGALDIWVSLDDPAWTANVNPTLNGGANTSMFNAVNLTGTAVNSGVACTGVLLADSVKLSFTNTNSFPVSISYLQLWGEPAKVVGGSPTITYDAYDDLSVDRFGEQVLEITDNTCFGNYDNVDAFATDILTKYAGYNPTIDLKVKGNPALQLYDVVTLSDTDYDGSWRIVGTKHNLSKSGLETHLTLLRNVEE